jgi:transglutaminase-like putative cysteine protease
MLLRSAVLLLAFSPSAFAACAGRNFEFNYAARLPPVGAGRTLRLWIPLPQSDRHQTISRVQVHSPARHSLQREPEYANEYLYLEAPGTRLRQPANVRVTFRVSRRENRVNLAGNGNGGLTGVLDLKRYLSPDRLVPTDGLIGQLAEQHTRGRNKPLDKARAIYDYVVNTMRYDKSGEGWGRGDAIFACNAKRGNCTDFHSLFIGMMRAAGIPARFQIGFSVPADLREGEIAGYHCWAEFYVQPYGWIPVDASEAWKNPGKRDYFFGAHDAHRVQFTQGRDILLRPAQQGERLNYFIYPYAEIDGKPLPGIATKFSFRDLAAGGPVAAH